MFHAARQAGDTLVPADYDGDVVVGAELSCLTSIAPVRAAETEDADDYDGDGNVTELIPQRDKQGLLVWGADYGDISNLESARPPVYARVDFRATFKPRWMNDRWQIFVEVMNLLNRKNASASDTNLEYDPNSDRPRIITKAEDGLPLLPSVGLRVRF
jgi:hypothetical protein